MEVGNVWGENVAVACVCFWMRMKYPKARASVSVMLDVGKLVYHTRINLQTQNGEYFVTSFGTMAEHFNPDEYEIPDETQAQLMMLLG